MSMLVAIVVTAFVAGTIGFITAALMAAAARRDDHLGER